MANGHHSIYLPICFSIMRQDCPNTFTYMQASWCCFHWSFLLSRLATLFAVASSTIAAVSLLRSPLTGPFDLTADLSPLTLRSPVISTCRLEPTCS